MPFLSPAKLLVILVIALFVLGPDKLPKVAKQIGGLWGDFSKFREKLESEVRGNFPDLPSTDTITQAVRSPLSFLDNLAGTHSSENEATSSASAGPPEVAGDTVIESPSETNRPAGPVQASELPPARAQRILTAESSVTVHQVRFRGEVGSDDPGMN